MTRESRSEAVASNAIEAAMTRPSWERPAARRAPIRRTWFARVLRLMLGA